MWETNPQNLQSQKSEALPVGGVLTPPCPGMMIIPDVFVSVSGYPPLQPASFRPQAAHRQGTVAETRQVTLHASPGFPALLPRQCERTLQRAANNLRPESAREWELDVFSSGGRGRTVGRFELVCRHLLESFVLSHLVMIKKMT